MNEDSTNRPIEPDLEARIVALVLGEASDFETEELERLIKSRPELALFKREMEQISQLLHEVGQNELDRLDAQWQLTSERRQVVLDVIHGNVATSEIGNSIRRDEEGVGKPPRFRKRRWMRILETAVVTAILVVLIGLTVFPGVQMVRESARRLARSKTFDSPKSWDSEISESVPPSEPSSAASFNSTDPMFSFGIESGGRQTEWLDRVSRQDSAAALSAIQNSLQPSDATASDELEVKLSNTQPMNAAGADKLPAQTWSAPHDVSAIELPYTPPDIGMITDFSSRSTTFSPTLQDSEYGRQSGIDPAADKFVDGFQTQPAVTPGGAIAEPGVVLPNSGSVQKLGGTTRSVEESSLALPAFDSIENETHFAERELSEFQGEVSGIIQEEERKPMIASRFSNQLSARLGEVKGDKQPSGQVLAEDATVADLISQIPEAIEADKDFRYPNSPNGRNLLGSMSDDLGGGDAMEDGGNQGGMGGVGGMGGGRGGSALGTKETSGSILRKEFGGGMPSGGERDDGLFELSLSVPVKPGSSSDGTTSELTMGDESKSGQEGKSGEAETNFADSDGQGIRNLELKLGMDNLSEKAEEGGGEEDLKQQSAEESRRRLSLRQRKHKSEVLSGQVDQKERVTKLDQQADGLEDKRFVIGREDHFYFYNQSSKDSNDANRDKPIDALGKVSQILNGENLELAKKPISKREVPPAGLNETNAATEAFSTFSLHVSDVSFKLAAAALARGEWPEAAKIRIEEFVNAFDYGDPLPGPNEKVACVVEQAIHPFLQQRNLLRVSMRTSAEGRAASTPLRLTLVLDNSGSMERIDRQQAVRRRALSLLAQQLSPSDQVTLISFARQPRLLAENVSGLELGKLVELIGQLPSEGGTNMESALKLAFEKAIAQPTTGVQNRIVLLTDGAVNLGNADPESLSRMVETMRTAGIAFDAAGISAEGLNDEVLEALTRKGDGRYYLLDGDESSGGRFAQQIAGALRPSASNVKVQVEFNPKRVGQYKLLGFEKHILQQEDFRNDAVDAAELAAAEAGVALYQFEAKADGEGDVGTVSVRFRDLATGQMIEQRWPIPYEANALRPDQAANSIRLAAAAAMLAARLRGDALGETVDLKSVSDLIAGLSEQQQYDPRVQQLKLMIEQARQVSER